MEETLRCWRNRKNKTLQAIDARQNLSAALLLRDYWSLLIVLGAYSFFWNAALPQFEAATMNNLGDSKHMYSRIRLWGSVGFIVTASLLAVALEKFGIQHLPWIVLVILLFTWINTLLVNERPSSLQKINPSTMWKTCMQPHVFALLLACFLIQASHGPYYTFFSIYAEDNGYSRSLIGQLWSLGVLAEVVVFYYMYRWLPKIGAKLLLVVAMLLTSDSMVVDCLLCGVFIYTFICAIITCSFIWTFSCLGYPPYR